MDSMRVVIFFSGAYIYLLKDGSFYYAWFLSVKRDPYTKYLTDVVSPLGGEEWMGKCRIFVKVVIKDMPMSILVIREKAFK